MALRAAEVAGFRSLTETDAAMQGTEQPDGQFSYEQVSYLILGVFLATLVNEAGQYLRAFGRRPACPINQTSRTI